VAETTLAVVRSRQEAQNASLAVQIARALDAEAWSCTSDQQAGKIQAQLDESQENMERYVEEALTFRDNLELRF